MGKNQKEKIKNGDVNRINSWIRKGFLEVKGNIRLINKEKRMHILIIVQLKKNKLNLILAN